MAQNVYLHTINHAAAAYENSNISLYIEDIFHFSHNSGVYNGKYTTRGPIGSQVYGLKSAVTRVLLEKYLSTQHVFNIYIKLQCFIMKMK